MKYKEQFINAGDTFVSKSRAKQAVVPCIFQRARSLVKGCKLESQIEPDEKGFFNFSLARSVRKHTSCGAAREINDGGGLGREPTVCLKRASTWSFAVRPSPAAVTPATVTLRRKALSVKFTVITNHRAALQQLDGNLA